jgi:hypothetical protein
MTVSVTSSSSTARWKYLINGNISNETPPRIIVLIETVVSSTLVEERGFLKKQLVRKIDKLNNPSLSRLWLAASKFGLSVELAAFEEEGWTQEHLDTVMDKLERRGGNPFNYSELYSGLEEFRGELPYRSNLKGVITDGKSGFFGSMGIDIDNL